MLRIQANMRTWSGAGRKAPHQLRRIHPGAASTMGKLMLAERHCHRIRVDRISAVRVRHLISAAARRRMRHPALTCPLVQAAMPSAARSIRVGRAAMVQHSLAAPPTCLHNRAVDRRGCRRTLHNRMGPCTLTTTGVETARHLELAGRRMALYNQATTTMPRLAVRPVGYLLVSRAHQQMALGSSAVVAATPL